MGCHYSQLQESLKPSALQPSASNTWKQTFLSDLSSPSSEKHGLKQASCCLQRQPSLCDCSEETGKHPPVPSIVSTHAFTHNHAFHYTCDGGKLWDAAQVVVALIDIAVRERLIPMVEQWSWKFACPA
jgi:hypothetical protein